MALAGLTCLLQPGHATPAARITALCDRAANAAARRYGVPPDVMLALTRTETGRSGPDGLHPWPWTVNIDGKGLWFDSAEAARAFVRHSIARGARSFDVGCFQINYKWHGKAFSSVNDMIDPWKNAAYAARFLSGLYRTLGDWTRAAGAYHSRTKRHAARYVRRFDRIRAALTTRKVSTGPGHVAPLTALNAVDRSDEPMPAPEIRLGSLVPSFPDSARTVPPLVSMNERVKFRDFIGD